MNPHVPNIDQSGCEMSQNQVVTQPSLEGAKAQMR
jgi:hypothetical protein